MRGVPDLELCRVNANGNAAGPCGQVITGERALVTLIQLARGAQCKWMRRYDLTPKKMTSQIVDQNAPSRVSK